MTTNESNQDIWNMSFIAKFHDELDAYEKELSSKDLSPEEKYELFLEKTKKQLIEVNRIEALQKLEIQQKKQSYELQKRRYNKLVSGGFAGWMKSKSIVRKNK